MQRMDRIGAICAGLLMMWMSLSLRTPAAELPSSEAIWAPCLDGDFWRIADDDPALIQAKLVSDGTSNVCDFTVYQDKNGLWHAIACVRGTDQPGQRLFYEWTSEDLESPDWQEVRELQWPRSAYYSDKPTSIQAPHALVYDNRYYCIYNSNPFGRLMLSEDGAKWTPWKNADGDNVLFRSGRDICVYRDPASSRWYAYFCGSAVSAEGDKVAAMVARSANSITGPWSDDTTVVRSSGNPESPFVLDYRGKYYLFQQTSVFVSDTPTSFEGEPIQHMTGIWYGGKYAPEIVVDNEQYYFAGYNRGLHIAKIKWVQKSPEQIQAWRDTEYKALLGERAAHKRQE